MLAAMCLRVGQVTSLPKPAFADFGVGLPRGNIDEGVGCCIQ
jgi:hypothetical protein